MKPQQIFSALVSIRLKGNTIKSGVSATMLEYLEKNHYTFNGQLTGDGFIFIQDYKGGETYREIRRMEDNFIEANNIDFAQYHSTTYNGIRFKI